MGKLSGKVAFITGASMGIGEGIAKAYAKHGAKLVLAARSKGTEELAQALNKQGGDTIAVNVDVTDVESIQSGIDKAIQTYGKIDVLVNNAGVCKLGNFLESSDADRDFHIDVNIKGVWNTTKLVVPYMIKQKYGKIVIMSSVTGDMVADPGEVAYATTKAALIGFTKAMAREMADYNITVNAICPGYVLTPMVKGMALQSNPDNPQSVIDGIARSIPLNRLADPIEVGELAAFLGCDESSYLTGTQIVIDGGSTLPETSDMGV
jgi:NAD(P)-dependent dehydrogenase (short-subunit alcohol dehydrogenase family)